MSTETRTDIPTNSRIPRVLAESEAWEQPSVDTLSPRMPESSKAGNLPEAAQESAERLRPQVF
jgi:hypothetical protein